MKSVVTYFQALTMSLLKGWVLLALKVYYRKVQVIGLENIPKDKPIIYAPNHQYAFMDALVVAKFSGKIPYFLVHADFFKSPISNLILRSLRMMPVYRAQNRNDLANKNETVFDKCVEVLSGRGHLIIFPEGNHSKIRRIRPIKKGIFRIAFRTISEVPEARDLVIIPVGVNYDDNSKFQSDLMLKFGEPITVSDYLKDYQENPGKTMDQLRDILHEKLISLTINIENAESYKFYEKMLRIYTRPYCMEKNYRFRNLDERFQAYNEIIEGMDRLNEADPEGFRNIQPEFNRFYNLLQKNRINTMALEKIKEEPRQRLTKVIILVILWPFYFYGLINNILALILPAYLGSRIIRDDHFLSSVHFALGLVTFPVMYFLQGLLVYELSDNLWISVIYVISIFFFGLFSQKYRFQFKKSYEILKFRRLLIKRKKDYRYILKTYREIIEYMHNNLVFNKISETA